MSISEKRLWAAQKREWPTSVQITLSEVYRWCESAPNEKTRLHRYRQISLALQDQRVVWYYLDKSGLTACCRHKEYRGFRYGVEGHEYMSLYSDVLE